MENEWKVASEELSVSLRSADSLSVEVAVGEVEGAAASRPSSLSNEDADGWGPFDPAEKRTLCCFRIELRCGVITLASLQLAGLCLLLLASIVALTLAFIDLYHTKLF
mmetsp:Transcript_10830/g.27802  ORF Transcript_10830/g.27802 Transcript_10830/m.27802 type:complete len:108 (-) Transcript_10830:175-498(-)